MMSTIYRAHLTEVVFRGLMPVLHKALGYSYVVWAERQLAEIEKWEAIGGTSVLVELSAGEVARYQHLTGASITSEELHALATCKALWIQTDGALPAPIEGWQLGARAACRWSPLGRSAKGQPAPPRKKLVARNSSDSVEVIPRSFMP
jgi:hypothetical protein